MAISNYQPSLALNMELTAYGAFPSRDPDTQDSFMAMGSIRTFAFTFSGSDTYDPNGQLVSINQNQALFAVLGITYGGNGYTTFGIPDLVGKVMVDTDSTMAVGYTDGSATVSLTQLNMPTSSGGSGQTIDNAQPELAVTTVISVYGYSAYGGFEAGAIMQFAGPYVPGGFLEARGQTLSVQAYPDLFAKLGTTYGGDGITTFMLPNIDGRTIIGTSSGVAAGTLSGSDNLTLTQANLPSGSGGSGEVIDNAQPSIALNYMIAVSGLFAQQGGTITQPDTGVIGEIMAFAGDVTSMTDWLPADGRLLAISAYSALFSLIGVRYGGDGTTTFALPDLSGRAIIGAGTSALGTFTPGDVYGSDVTLTADDIPNMVINGTNASETLTGADGDDLIYGNGGNDVLYGLNGNDTLVGGSGGDALRGNGSTTIASYANSFTGVTADLSNTTNNTGDAAGDSYYNIIRLTGSGYVDTLVGDDAANVLDGGAGNDTLSGKAGWNTLTGGAGSDLIIVTTGNDLVTDFTVGTDKIQATGLDGNTTLAEIMALVDKNNSQDAIFTFTNGSSLTLKGVLYSNLTLADFVLAPVITTGSGSAASYSISENTDTIATVAVVDGNGGNITFSITGGADASLFTIDSATGTLTFNTSADYETPADADFNNVYDIIVTATDTTGLTDVQAIAITVTDTNDAPTGGATATLVDGTEDAAFTVTSASLLQGFDDQDGNTLSVADLAASDGAVVVDNQDGTFTITPASDYNGAITLSYSVSDGLGGTVAASLSVTLDAVNDAPTGTSTAVFSDGTEDTDYTFTLADLLQGFTDVDGDALSIGSLSIDGDATLRDNNDGTYTIIPAVNFNGTLTLSFAVEDAGIVTVSGSKQFVFDAENDAPAGSATAVLANGTEDTAYVVSAADLLVGFSDVEDTLSMEDLVASDDATVLDNGDGTYTITPATDFHGTLTLTYNVKDGQGGVIAASQDVVFEAFNDTPVGPPTVVLENGVEDTAYIVSAADLLQGLSDADSDALVIASISISGGAVLVDNNDGTYTIAPAGNFHGDVTISYTVSDGEGGAVDATRSVTFDAVNDAPTGAAIAVLTRGTQNSAYIVSASDLLLGFSDADEDTLSISGLAASGNATVTDNNDGTCTITPATDFLGAVTLSYTVGDSHGGTIAGSRSVTFGALNNAPTGQPTAVLVDGVEDTAYTVSAANLLLGITDADNDTLVISGIAVSGGAGLVSNNNGTYTITPAANFHGEVTISYTVSDGNGGTIAATRSVTFDAVNDVPTGAATAVLAHGTEDAAYSVSAADLLQGFADADQDTLSISGLAASGGATVTDNHDGTYTITPLANFNGAVTLSYTVGDGHGGTIADSRSVTFDALNDAPTVANAIVSQLASIGEALSLVLPIGAFADVDSGDTLAYEAALENGDELPSWLSFDPDTKTFSGMPDSDAIGTLNIRITVTDGSGASVSDVFDLVVADTNLAPTGAATATLAHGTEDVDYTVSTANLLAGFSDADGDTLTVLDLEASAGAAIVDNGDGTFTISTVEDFNGSVALTYTVSDGRGGTIAGSRSVIFDAVSDAPEGADNTISIEEDHKYSFSADDFGFTDADDNALAGVMITALPSEGTLTLAGAKVKANQVIAVGKLDDLVWKPAKDASGDALATLEFKVKDNGSTASGGVNLETTSHTITFDVSAVVDIFKGTEKGDKLNGTDDADILIGKGGNDTLTGRDGGDTFVFQVRGGKDMITDFTAGDGDHDMIDLSKIKWITDFEDLLAEHVLQKGSDLVIVYGTDDNVLVKLKNIEIDDLDASNFLF